MSYIHLTDIDDIDEQIRTIDAELDELRSQTESCQATRRSLTGDLEKAASALRHFTTDELRIHLDAEPTALLDVPSHDRARLVRIEYDHAIFDHLVYEYETHKNYPDGQFSVPLSDLAAPLEALRRRWSETVAERQRVEHERHMTAGRSARTAKPHASIGRLAAEGLSEDEIRAYLALSWTFA